MIFPLTFPSGAPLLSLLPITHFLLLISCMIAMSEASSLSTSTDYAIYATAPKTKFAPLTFKPPSTLTLNGTPVNTTENPLWITFDTNVRKHKRAYVIHGIEPGRVSVIERQGENLQVVGDKGGFVSGASGPVASCVQHECLYLANYGAGSASVLSLDEDGLPITTSPTSVFQFVGSGPVTDRQEQAHAHDAVLSPDGRFVYIVDLGTDRIHHINVAAAGQDCSHASFDEQQDTVLAPGTGPRHITFYTDKRSHRHFGYLCNELGGTLIAFEQDAASGALRMIGTPQYALPKDVPLGGNATAGPAHTLAEVVVSQDGRFVYVSDRGDPDEDHISIFARDAQTGSVSFIKWALCGGKGPRHFSFSNDDKFVAVANEISGNVAILARDPSTGDLHKTGASVQMEGVNFAGFDEHL